MTDPVSLTKPAAAATPTPAAPARATPAPATLRRRARAAVARSLAGDRSLAVLLGLLLLVAGVLVTLLCFRVFGVARAGRPLLDPMIVDLLRGQQLLARWVAIGGGLLLVLLGLTWAARSLRPERRPDLVLDGGRPETRIVINATAAADAVAAQAGALPGVRRARARLVGSERAPALRVTLWLTEDAEVRSLLGRLDDTVLASARQSLDLAALPVAVRLELAAPSSPPRVA
jgi:hypothetical protein